MDIGEVISLGLFPAKCRQDGMHHDLVLAAGWTVMNLICLARKWRGKTVLGSDKSWVFPPTPQEGDGWCWETSEWQELVLKYNRWQTGTVNAVLVPLWLKFPPVCFCFAQGWWQSHLNSQQTNNSPLSYSPPVSCPNFFQCPAAS